jgi:hypothetical protein
MAPPKPMLDPIAVLRTLAGTPAYVIVTFGPGSDVRGSVIACDDDVSVLIDHEAAASFVRHDAVVAVTVRDAHAFGEELGLPGRGEPDEERAPNLAPPMARVTEGTGPPALGQFELEQMLRSTGFAYDQSAVTGLNVIGRTGLATLASAVGNALQSIQSDPVADAAMTKDVTDVRLENGPVNRVAIEGTTLVVTSSWSGGPMAVYESGALRADILDAAS